MFVILCVLFGGFFIGVDELPTWIAWFRYCSFVFWGFTAMTMVVFPPGSGNEIDALVRQTADLVNIDFWICTAVLGGLVVLTTILGYFFQAKLRAPKFVKL